ncbi:PTS sugar transporter subunit IIA [Desulfoferrobacter suflitae]|uniref:PTS sugar transporter subunit IIA n=1 Tax=Desulfoferrobacter suflitae TaxID=2865782 RepID=UPI002164E771|nr:PTS sugar transporter subunit IIA [Desulfoferrobacter suflitae]MCK8603141.1 PTS sugar transporter subunit IIA [Desulfoferrobacter suflitae]
MKIWERLQADEIYLDMDLRDKDSVMRFIAEAFARAGIVEDAVKLYDGLQSREAVLSTGIGNGIGIPHTTSDEADRGAMLLIRLATPIEFDSLDALPVDIVLALVVPAQETVLHLQILAGIARLCRNPRFLQLIRGAADSQDLLNRIRELEEEMAFH